MFDWPQLPAPRPVARIQETTLLQISEPTLDSAQGKHFQHTMRIRNSTSLQTSPPRQAQELKGPAHHTTRWIHLDRKTKSHLAASPEDTVRNLFSIPFCVSFGNMNRAALSKALASSVSVTEVCCVTTAVYSVSFLVPARTICHSSRERRAFWRRRYPRISNSKKV